MENGEVPNWDLDQLEVITEPAEAWQLVAAGPGSGKTAVACQRIALLIDDGIPASRILLVSFTRTAVTELRNRIVKYAAESDKARSVQISTIDSHAWSLRTGFDDDETREAFGGSYEMNIERVVEMFRTKHTELIDFMRGLSHLLVDEAQDVVGVRADLVMEMLGALSDDCGVTIFADPAQAIYGFTNDVGDGDPRCSAPLVDRLDTQSPRPLMRREFHKLHRTDDPQLIDMFEDARAAVQATDDDRAYLESIQDAVRRNSHQNRGSLKFDELIKILAAIEGDSTLVLFRRRADALMGSSYVAGPGLAHRLRMSGLPPVIAPWIGWLFSEYGQPLISRRDFESLWEDRAAIAPNVFAKTSPDDAWKVLFHLAAGRRKGSVDLIFLRQLLSRARPPVEVCTPELGDSGPILGTIHASKGREADTVLLVMPPTNGNRDAKATDGNKRAALHEEGRVYYVGATRARRFLWVGSSKGVGASQLDSGRVYRHTWGKFPGAQIEVGRDGDVDTLAPLNWGSPQHAQVMLARAIGEQHEAYALLLRELDYVPKLYLRGPVDGKADIPIGMLSLEFKYDLNKIWDTMKNSSRVRPADEIRHLRLTAVTTVALPDDKLGAVQPPYRQSGFALAPVITGFTKVPFFRRKGM